MKHVIKTDGLIKPFVFIVFILNCMFIYAARETHYTICNVTMYSAPDCGADIVALIPNGTSVYDVIEDCDCEWIPVEYNGNIGYVQSQHLTKSQSINSRNHNKHYSRSKKSSYKKRKKRYAPRGINHRRSVALGSVDYYINSYGRMVQRPTRYRGRPAGATALCRDGTYSFSQSARGTCSGHGGVARWL